MYSRGSNVANTGLISRTSGSSFCALCEDDPRVKNNISCEQASLIAWGSQEWPERTPGQCGADVALGLCEEG